MGVGEGLLIVLGVGLATYLMRAGLILLLANRKLPDAVERALRYVGPAVLAALTVSLAFGSSEGGAPDLEFAKVGALVAAGGVAAWKRNLTVTLVVGMCVFWLLDALT